MVKAHLGVAITAIGITFVSAYSDERDLRMVSGDKVTLAGYQFEFKGTQRVSGENFEADQGQIIVTEDNEVIATLSPQKRRYNVNKNMMTEADIDSGLFRDLYVALGEPLGDGAWAVRVHYKPFVRWLWLGGIFMALGGICTVFDKRYRKDRSVIKEDEIAHA
jgi:cytochrome c-type biogenesis protein CcmF